MGKDPGGVTRSQNVVYVVSHDWASISYFLAPLIERVDENVREVQVLVLTADAEAAAAVSGAAVKLAGSRSVGIIAATSTARTSRLLKTLPAHVVVGDPTTVLELVRGSALKLSSVRGVAFAWADAILAEKGLEEPIATLLADVPKEAARTIATTEVTPAVEDLVERYARRARRVVSAATADTTPIAVEYVTTAETARGIALRRLLDALDLDNASVFVRGDNSRAEASDLLRSLGYAGDAPIRLSHGGGAPSTVILYDLPASREELTEAMGASARRVIALIQPRQLSSLRALAGGGRVRPLALPDAAKRLRGRDAALRDELRAVLDRGTVTRTLFAIEPLLEEYDGVDIAAAALELLERERETPRVVESVTAPAASEGFARLFFSVGARDGLRVGEVVATIGNDAGVPSSELGKIDIRETHSIVEVAPARTSQVIEKLTGKTMAGRRLIVRPDQGMGGEGAPRSRGAAGSRRDSSRPPRAGSGSGPGRPRSDRPRPDRPRGGGGGGRSR